MFGGAGRVLGGGRKNMVDWTLLTTRQRGQRDHDGGHGEDWVRNGRGGEGGEGGRRTREAAVVAVVVVCCFGCVARVWMGMSDKRNGCRRADFICKPVVVDCEGRML